MVYRVLFIVGYMTAWFDFVTIEAAGEFAKTILVHNVPNKDTEDRKTSVTIQLVDREKEAEDE